MSQTKSFSKRGAILAGLTLVGLIVGKLLMPGHQEPRNAIAQMDLNKIGAAWFVPSGKADDEIVWLDHDQIQPLYEIFSSKIVADSPSKWIHVGRVGFTYPNGRVASIELYDTNSDQGAFRSGTTYFRYHGSLPACIQDAR